MDLKEIFRKKIDNPQNNGVNKGRQLELEPLNSNSYSVVVRGVEVGSITLVSNSEGLLYLQFHNVDKTSTYLSDIFNSGIRLKKDKVFSYDPLIDTINYKNTELDIFGLFALLHEYGHSFQDQSEHRAATLAEAKLILIRDAEAKNFFTRDEDWSRLLENQINILCKRPEFSIWAFTREELTSNFSEIDRHNILTHEFDASVFALREFQRIFEFIGISREVQIDLVDEVAEEALRAYKTYEEDTELYLDVNVLDETREVREFLLKLYPDEREASSIH